MDGEPFYIEFVIKEIQSQNRFLLELPDDFIDTSVGRRYSSKSQYSPYLDDQKINISSCVRFYRDRIENFPLSIFSSTCYLLKLPYDVPLHKMHNIAGPGTKLVVHVNFNSDRTEAYSWVTLKGITLERDIDDMSLAVLAAVFDKWRVQRATPFKIERSGEWVYAHRCIVFLDAESIFPDNYMHCNVKSKLGDVLLPASERLMEHISECDIKTLSGIFVFDYDSKEIAPILNIYLDADPEGFFVPWEKIQPLLIDYAGKTSCVGILDEVNKKMIVLKEFTKTVEADVDVGLILRDAGKFNVVEI